jgi:23S rRNA (uracil1939-C5)-methyltransferase
VGRKRKLPLYEEIEIVEIASEGKALAKVNDKVVFVPQAIPGDVVDVQVSKRRKKYEEGMIMHFHKYSELRTEPFCEHFGTCGGCKWQHLPYPEQLRFKQKQILDNFERIGKIEIRKVNDILPSDKTRYYRNKMEFTFSNKRWLTQDEINSGEPIMERNALGFHVPGMFDKILDLNVCYLQPDPSDPIRLFVRDYALKNGYTFFDIRNHEGFLRNLIIRTSSTGEVMVIVSFYHEDIEKREALMNALMQKFPGITSLMYVINGKPHDSIGDLDVLPFAGRDHIFEKMEKLRFKIGPKSFYQTNSDQAYELYKIVRRFTFLTGKEVVYDLYTGTGTIANFVSERADKVIGIEYVPEAILDAKENSRLNRIFNTDFYAGDMKEVLTEAFFSVHGRPDVIITDPPRAGMHEKVVKSLLYAEPAKIVYVSCNPATQARDIQLLSDKYCVKEIQPVDMFPHTHHVENVALLIHKDA